MDEMKLRYLLRPREVANRSHLEVLSVYRDYGVVPKGSRGGNNNKTPEDLSRYQEVRSGDLVINKMKAWQGSLGVSDHHGIVSPDYLVCAVEKTVNPSFLHHLMRSPTMAAEYAKRSKGIRPAQWRLYWEDLAEIHVMLPPVEEQRRIADFLDAETGNIDDLIRLRREFAVKLQERERVVLDSAVDRLAESYGTLPFRRYIRRTEQGSSPQCDNVAAGHGEWGVLKVSAVKGGRFHEGENKRLPDDIAPVRKYEVRDGDLLITRANTPTLVGTVAVAEYPRERLTLCDKIFRIEVDERLNKRFFALVAGGTRIRDLCQQASHGTSQSMANLKIEEIKQWPVPAAPLDEQKAFVVEFQRKASLQHQLAEQVERQVELLEEKKRALITAAVTGEFDVSSASGRG